MTFAYVFCLRCARVKIILAFVLDAGRNGKQQFFSDFACSVLRITIALCQDGFGRLLPNSITCLTYAIFQQQALGKVAAGNLLAFICAGRVG